MLPDNRPIVSGGGGVGQGGQGVDRGGGSSTDTRLRYPCHIRG